MIRTHGRYSHSAITERPNWRWPNGAGLALYVALGIEDYAFGQGRTENILPGIPQPDFVNTAWRDYGNRVGAFRLLDRLASYGIRPAVLLNTAVYDSAPSLIRAIRAAGAEIVAHGQANSDCLSGLSEAEERHYIRETSDRIAQEEGARPSGWSSPWLAHTPRTFDLLSEQGFGYLLDMRLDDQPVWLRTQGAPLLAIPYSAELNDSSTAVGRYASARDFSAMIVDEFDEMLLATRDQPLVMSIVIHSFISGQPFRLRALSRALDHIIARRDLVWLTQPGEIAGLITSDPNRAV
jgi:peptidoglycan/xylan/chitin deacetylase (PgdA/CDA1 family)